jgi:hypothetical protein
MTEISGFEPGAVNLDALQAVFEKVASELPVGRAAKPQCPVLGWVEAELAAVRKKRDELGLVVDAPTYRHDKHFGLLQERTRLVLKIAWLQSLVGLVECWHNMDKITLDPKGEPHEAVHPCN